MSENDEEVQKCGGTRKIMLNYMCNMMHKEVDCPGCPDCQPSELEQSGKQARKIISKWPKWKQQISIGPCPDCQPKEDAAEFAKRLRNTWENIQQQEKGYSYNCIASYLPEAADLIERLERTISQLRDQKRNIIKSLEHEIEKLHEENERLQKILER